MFTPLCFGTHRGLVTDPTVKNQPRGVGAFCAWGDWNGRSVDPPAFIVRETGALEQDTCSADHHASCLSLCCVY